VQGPEFKPRTEKIKLNKTKQNKKTHRLWRRTGCKKKGFTPASTVLAMFFSSG
jgi:hypothetical protein